MPNTVNANTTTEYTDTSSNVKYLLDEVSKTATVIGYTGTDISLDIPSVLTNNEEQYTVTQIGDLAFLQCKTLTSITIPSTVTSIGEKVFNRCDNLEAINIAKR